VTPRARTILAVDGGGSKVDVALLRPGGEVLGATRRRLGDLERANWVMQPQIEGRHLLPLGGAIAEVARQAGLEPDGIPLADVGVFCLAGADLPSDERRLLAWVRGNGWVERPQVHNDTFAVLRTGTDRPWGVAVVCGYGTNCTGVAPDGRVTRFPAVGPISGDWGGGSEIGSLAAWHAVRSEDGRGAKTSLQRLVPEHFGLRRPRQLTEAMYFEKISEERLADLAPIVFQAAGDGDAVARDIVNRQADEIVTMAGTAIRRLRMTKLDVEVVLGGGIFRNRDDSFFDRIREGLLRVAPASSIVPLAAPPVVGAALIGLDLAGARPAARRTLRAALTEERVATHTRPRRKER
jgi:N-acetylglucosamine kinase-like BadF-type ATPase